MSRVAFPTAEAALVGLAIVTSALAQESPTRPTDSSAEAAAQPAVPPPATTVQPASPAATSSGLIAPPATTAASGLQADTQRGAFLRASSFIGLPVQGLGDARLGTVGDILIDPRTYELRYVLIDTGPGVGTNGLPIIPWALFQTSPAGPLNRGFLMVPLSSDRLAQAPVTTLGANDLAGSSAWIRDVDNYYALDLSVRRVSRPEFDAEAEAKSRGTQGAATAPPMNDRRETLRDRAQQQRSDARNRIRSRTGAAAGTPGAVDPDRNRGPATRVPGATDNTGRNRGPATTTPGSVDNAGRNRGPASTTPGSVDNASRNRGPTAPSAASAGGTGTGPAAESQPGTGTTGASGGTSAGSSSPGASSGTAGGGSSTTP